MIDNMPCSYTQHRNLFIEESKQLIEILGNHIIEIHHYGSSAVEGMPFTGDIHIMPVIKSYQRVEESTAEFEQLGFEYMERSPDSILFQKRKGSHRICIRWVEQEDMGQVHTWLLIRNYLRRNEEAREKYAHLQLKNRQQTAGAFEFQIHETEYLTMLLEEAEEWEKRF
ncbi:GrpB family protein [Macrococcus carouselicus]|uniref:GrpB family protein n=1 Tax=Macrococcus carouselicus TaxID=69969 RepID=A0A9Q8FPU7_9STAP|nr:GrpB family protein [Macrococcus carouselicus]TDM00729.1 hypothetical protein ERX40_09310 [Macrococcus carouselicus]